MAQDPVATDRDALYYPNIHIRDCNWLKATLLCFPQVRRMVPYNFTPQDDPEILPFTKIEGPRGPLLDSVDLFSDSGRAADELLLMKLRASDDTIRRRYNKAATVVQFGDRANDYQIHEEKIIIFLYEYLTSSPNRDPDNVLAWRASSADGMDSWISLHPELGKAVLSTKAIGLAKAHGLDVVTDSAESHVDIAFKDEDAVFDRLLGIERVAKTRPDDMIDDLAEIVMATTFDVTKLSASQIAELLNNGCDLRRFKDALAPIVARIPPVSDPKERQRRLDDAVAQVRTEWQEYRRSLPRYALDALSSAAEVSIPALPLAVLHSFVWPVALPAYAGLSIAYFAYKGFNIWQSYKEAETCPYRYLSRIEKSGGILRLPPSSSRLA